MAQYAQVVRDGGALARDITIKNTDTVVMTKGHIIQIDTAVYPGTYADPIACKNIGTGDDDAVAYAVVVDDTIAVGATGRVCRRGPVVALAGTGGVTINNVIQLDSQAGHEGHVMLVPNAVAAVGTGVGMAERTAAVDEFVLIDFQPGFITTA
jgi:hypothetical protein